MEHISLTGARELTGEYGYCPHKGEEGIGEKASDASSVTDFVGVGGMVLKQPSESISNSASGNGLRRTREFSPPAAVRGSPLLGEPVFDIGVMLAGEVSGRKSPKP
jgi:hypothetical protein